MTCGSCTGAGTAAPSESLDGSERCATCSGTGKVMCTGKQLTRQASAGAPAMLRDLRNKLPWKWSYAPPLVKQAHRHRRWLTCSNLGGKSVPCPEISASLHAYSNTILCVSPQDSRLHFCWLAELSRCVPSRHEMISSTSTRAGCLCTGKKVAQESDPRLDPFF